MKLNDRLASKAPNDCRPPNTLGPGIGFAAFHEGDIWEEETTGNGRV